MVSNSKTVLSWIRADQRKYRQFVAFRVSEINEFSDVNEWRYIPTADNVADDGTKWPKKSHFSSNDRWYHGPQFLYSQQENWPDDCILEATKEEELKPNLHRVAVEGPDDDLNETHFHHAVVQQFKVIDPEKFSSWTALRWRVIMIRRFYYNAGARMKKRTRRIGVFSREEYREAECIIFKLIQKEVYAAEITILHENKKKLPHEAKRIDKKSAIYGMNPYLDADGLLRSHGRIDSAKNVKDSIKRPILLPHSHHVTNLIVLFYHAKYYHLNSETVVNEIRQVFHIPKLRIVVKTVI